MSRPTRPTARRSSRFAAAAAFACAFALSASACQLEADTSDAATPPSARPAAQLDGIWRSVGYGWALDARGRRPQLYELTRSTCQQTSRFRARAHGGAVRLFAEDGLSGFDAVAGARPGSLRLQSLGSVGTVELRRAAALPARCRVALRTDAATATRVLTETFAEQYPFFAVRGVDWRRTTRALERATRRPLPAKRLFDVYRRALAPLHDAHVTLLDPRSEAEWSGRRPDRHPLAPADHARVQQIVERRLGTRLRTFANGRIFYARTRDGIGYLRIVAFGGYAGDAVDPDRDARALDRALDAILGGADAPQRGLVVDVRENVGGYDALQLKVAARLTRERYLAFRKATQIAGGRAPRLTRAQAVDVVPAAGRPGWHGALALLTGRDTESAGETFVLALMGRAPGVARIGETTQGVYSDQVMRRLPNGWLFGLPSEIYTAPDGTRYEGRGIPPTDARPVFTPEDLASRRDPALDQALARLADA